MIFTSLLCCLGLIFLAALFRMARTRGDKNKVTLVLILKNTGDVVEGVMWDLIRLQKWHSYVFDLIVIDDNSGDDNLKILKKLQKEYGFTLLSSSLCQAFQFIQKICGTRVEVVKVVGPESLKGIRKKILSTLAVKREKVRVKS